MLLLVENVIDIHYQSLVCFEFSNEDKKECLIEILFVVQITFSHPIKYNNK